MPSRIVRTYQQNFISSTANDIWDFTFAPIPHKARPNNRFKVSVSSLSAYQSATTVSASLRPHIFWAKNLSRSIANTGAGDVNTRQVLGDTLLGVVGQAHDVNTITASTTKFANSIIGTPYYFYLDEIPTNHFTIYYTELNSYTYSSSVPSLDFVISFLIEEEEAYD
jgi:hypothetical protein